MLKILGFINQNKTRHTALIEREAIEAKKLHRKKRTYPVGALGDIFKKAYAIRNKEGLSKVKAIRKASEGTLETHQIYNLSKSWAYRCKNYGMELK